MDTDGSTANRRSDETELKAARGGWGVTLRYGLLLTLKNGRWPAAVIAGAALAARFLRPELFP